MNGVSAFGDPGTRVLLAGTGTHHAESDLPPIPAVQATLTDLGQVLVERCGLNAGNLRVVRDPVSPSELGIALAEEAERAENLLWVHYVGHGLVSPAGELYLAASATDRRPGRIAHTALAYTAVRDSLLQTAARRVVVVLDCCFSGRAVGTLGDSDGQEADLARVHGGFVLAAAARDELALAMPGEPHTVFSGELIRLLQQGDPEGPRNLTLRHAYQYLDRTLRARNLPRPRSHASEWISDLVLCPNPSYRPPTAPEAPALEPRGETRALEVCPYPGLASFGQGEAQWFFGRERLTSDLVTRLARHMDATTPLVVVGPSGSGKSSLLAAGLLPALGKGAPPAPGSRTWPRLLFTPTEHPLTELSTRLAQLTGGSPAALRAEMVASPEHFAVQLRDVLRARAGGTTISGTRLVLVIDQLEEVFTHCSDEHERQLFIRALCAAADGGDDEPPALVVLGLRADFYGRCADYAGLRSALQDSSVVVGPMTAAELSEAITQPARMTGLALQPGLVKVILHDVGAAEGKDTSDPGTLPLLSHALQSAWHRRENHTLTVTGYLDTGSIRGAIAATAEAAYAQLGQAEQHMVRLLMLRLVRVGDGAPDTRRRMSRILLAEQLTQREAGAAALEALIHARLVTADAATVQITHEAVLRAWPRLREWIDTDRAGLHLRQQLAEAAATWDAAERDRSHLYQGTRLDLARQWAADHQSDLSPLEQEFLEAGARTARRRTRRRRQLFAALTALLVFAVAGAGLAIQQSQAARAQRQIAVARQLAAQSASASGQPEAAMLYGIEAYRQNPTLVEARSALLSNQGQYFRARLTGHTETVNRVTFSPDGKTMATTSNDDTARLWDTSGRHTIAILRGHGDNLNGVAYSRDGRLLATANVNGTAQLWDVARHRLITTLTGHSAPVWDVAFSPDGKTLATASLDGTARLWDVERHHLIATLAGHSAPVWDVAFSPDGKTLATASEDKTVGIWQVSTHHRLATLTDSWSDPLLGAAFSPDGKILATAGGGGTVSLWDVDHRRLIAALTGHSNAVNDLAFSHDGSTLATASTDGTARLWDMANHRPIATLAGHTGSVWGVAFTPDGKTLATTSTDRSVVLWSLAGSVLTSHPISPTKALAFSPDGHTLATAGGDGRVTLWDPVRRRLTAMLTGHEGGVWALTFSPDGGTLATVGSDGTAKLWSVARHRLIATLTGHKDAVWAVAFSPDGHTLATGSYDRTVKLWNARSHRLITTLTNTGAVLGLAFSPNGRTLAMANAGKSPQLWSVADRRATAILTGHTATVGRVEFSPDGRLLVTASADDTAMLWDAASHRRIATLVGHTGTVQSAAFSPDGRTLATVSDDKTIRLWDVSDHHLIAILSGHAGTVTGVAFAPDGRTLATTSEDGTTRLWDPDPHRVTVRDCQLIGPVNRARWSKLMPDLPYDPICREARG